MAGMAETLHIVGGGMAGSEAAWQAAQMGVRVVIHEMRPKVGTFAHQTGLLGEMVCSNSFRSDDSEQNAVGLLHWEMRQADGLIMATADRHRLPAGGALAVDRDPFAQSVTDALTAHPNISVAYGEITALPDAGHWIIATGPLTSSALGQAIAAETGAEALAFFESVTSGLDAAGVQWTRAESLVRGLDYYRHTAFEFIPDEGSAAADALGAQSTVLGGGRYDGLMESLGGPATPAVGWAAGIERLAMLVGAWGEDAVEFAVIPVGAEAELKAIEVAQTLRMTKFSAESFARGNMKKRFNRADQAGAKAASIIGEDEMAAGLLQFKDLTTGEQQGLWLEDIIEKGWDLRFDEDLDALGDAIDKLEEEVQALPEAK